MQIVGQVAGRAVPLRRTLGEHLPADPLQLVWDRVVDLAWRHLLEPGDRLHDLRRRIAPKWLAAGQELVEDRAQAEDVGPPVYPVPLTFCLLGTHVGRCSREVGSLAVVLVL